MCLTIRCDGYCSKKFCELNRVQRARSWLLGGGANPRVQRQRQSLHRFRALATRAGRLAPANPSRDDPPPPAAAAAPPVQSPLLINLLPGYPMRRRSLPAHNAKLPRQRTLLARLHQLRPPSRRPLAILAHYTCKEAALEVLDALPTRNTECSLLISLPYWLSQVQYSLFFLIHECKDMIAAVLLLLHIRHH